LTGAPARLRSLLFAPATRPDVVEKLPRSRPDGVVIDLEDAVAPEAKDRARGHAREHGSRLARENAGLAVYVRVNAVHSEWFTADMRDALDPALAGVVVPKLEHVDELRAVAEALVAAGCPGAHVVAGIETATGVERVGQLLRPPVEIAYFGAEDFIADMGGVRTDSGFEVLYARSRVALGARLAGVHALDQIVTAFGDDERFLGDAREGRAIGYRGKLCIHPSQVKIANRVFAPSAEEIEHARRLLAAHDEARARGDAVVAFDGQMIDEPMVRRARDTLAAARPT
jgi:citrate lyase subunit beta/citryl-CoA lyase